MVFEQLGLLFEIFTDPFLIGVTIASVIVGVSAGMIPGLNASVTVAILLPLAFGMDPVTAMIFFFGIYAGAQYGGSVSAILINTPGTTAAAATTFDGYPMSRNGESGRALGIAAFASGVGGLFSILVLITLGPAFAEIALSFGQAEIAAVSIFGLSLVSAVSGDSLAKGLVGTALGIFIATVGRDPVSGYERFTFDMLLFADGIDFIAALIGLFAFSEVLLNVETITETVRGFDQRVESTFPSLSDIRESARVIVLGMFVGSFVGLLPGSGSTLGSFINYGVAQRVAHRGKEFGNGVIEGVASSEAANNAATGGAMIPLLVLGIPGSGTTAVMLGAMDILGVTPGPQLFSGQGDIWLWFGGFLLANVLFVLVAFMLLPIFVRVLETPRPILFAVIAVLTVVGTFALEQTLRQAWLMFAMGVLGYILRKFDFPVGPIVLAIVLAPLIELGVRRSLAITNGAVLPIVSRPIVAVLLVLSVITFFSPYFDNAVRFISKRAVDFR